MKGLLLGSLLVIKSVAVRVSAVKESTSGSKVTVKVVDTPLARESTVKSENTKSRALAPSIDRARL